MSALTGFREIADVQAATRQDTEEGYWFGGGPQAGIVSGRDLRMVGVSTRNPQWTDLTCFARWDLSPRSVYQKFTMPRDCKVGVVEVDFIQPSTQPYFDIDEDETEGAWAQVSIYANDGAGSPPTPGTVLGRCIPFPLSMLTNANTQRFFLPLWEPVSVSKNDVVWVGVGPKAYTGSGESPSGDMTNITSYLVSRGNREAGASDFIASDDVEPPLITYTPYDDRRIFVRLHEAPHSVDMMAPAHVPPPTSSSGHRAIVARPQQGRIESAYALGVRPGHGTYPWGSEAGGAYYWVGLGGGAGTLLHNSLGGLQGGLLGERYHFQEAVHDLLGGWIIGDTQAFGAPPYIDYLDYGYARHILFPSADGLIIGVGGANRGDHTEVARFVSDGVTFHSTTSVIRTDSVDGSDTKRIIIAPTDVPGAGRGGYAQVFGNDYGGGYSGSIALLPGDSNEGGVLSDKVWVGGDGIIPFTAGLPSLGTIERYWKRLLTAAGSAAAPAVAAGPYPTTGIDYPSGDLGFNHTATRRARLTATELRPEADGLTGLGVGGGTPYRWKRLALYSGATLAVNEGEITAVAGEGFSQYIAGQRSYIAALRAHQATDDITYTSGGALAEQDLVTKSVYAPYMVAGNTVVILIEGCGRLVPRAADGGASLTLKVRIEGIDLHTTILTMPAHVTNSLWFVFRFLAVATAKGSTALAMPSTRWQVYSVEQVADPFPKTINIGNWDTDECRLSADTNLATSGTVSVSLRASVTDAIPTDPSYINVRQFNVGLQEAA